MENNDFIPVDANDLYQKLVREKFKGQLSLVDNWIIWNYINKITIKVSINNQPHEGYIETIYLLKAKEINLTHWHPMEEEIYRDLTDINNGKTFWILKKRKLIFEPLPIIVSKKEYESYSEKKRNKYYVLN